MVVVDASVVYKWFNIEEEKVDQALQILESHLKKQKKVVVPDIILYELANVWSTKTALTAEEAIINLRQLKEHALDIVPVDFILLEEAIKICKKYQISVYDAYYIMLAKKNKCQFITADLKLVSQVSLPFVKPLE